MLNANVDSAGSSGANGVAIVNLTLSGPTAVTDLTGAIRNDQGPLGLRSRLIAATTSADVSGEPSENLTPWRRVNTASRPPFVIFQLVANSGSTLFPLFESFTSRSYICSSVKIERSSIVWYGSIVKMSAMRAMVSVPPADAVVARFEPPTALAVAARAITTRTIAT